MAAKSKKPIRLDLSTTGEIERIKFAVDSKLYEFRHKDELSLKEIKAHTFAGQVLAKYFEGEDAPTEQDNTSAQTMLDEAVQRITVGLPKKVMAGLGGLQQFELLNKFNEVNGLTGGDEEE